MVGRGGGGGGEESGDDGDGLGCLAKELRETVSSECVKTSASETHPW